MVVPSEPSPTCDASALRRAKPWAGKLIAREAFVRDDEVSQVLVDHTVLCNGAALEDCRSWATDYAHKRYAGTSLRIDVNPRSEPRGTMFDLRVDGRPELRVVRTLRDFAELVRSAQTSSRQLEVVTLNPVVEPRNAKLRLTLRRYARVALPAERWTLEFERSELSALELSLALSDLETTGVELAPESHDALYSAVYEISPRAASWYVMTPLVPGTGERTTAEVVVRCTP